ncbi:hypothetical protein ACFXKS_10610 [Streptomyces scopuliridis]|uniref:hypothetical protein n=1 Tax=Streptomyces scopuliridis TaxID=452529 RepID=UPI0036B830B2
MRETRSSPAPAVNGVDLADLLDGSVNTLDDSLGDDVLGTRVLLTAEDPWCG